MDIEQQAQAEVRRTVPGFDALAYADQQSLVNTRISEWQAQARISTGTDGRPQLREREIVSRPLVPQAPAADVPMRELRRRLQDAQRQLKAAIERVAQMNVLAERSQQRLASTHADLAKFNTLDKELEEFELQSLREDDDAGLPYNLKRRLEDRSATRDRAERAGAAHNRVVAEQRDAHASLASAKSAVTHARQAIAVATAREFIGPINECLAELATYRAVIASLQLPANMPADLTHAIARQPGSVRSDPAMVDRWRKYMSALRSNSDAVFLWCGNERDNAS